MREDGGGRRGSGSLRRGHVCTRSRLFELIGAALTTSQTYHRCACAWHERSERQGGHLFLRRTPSKQQICLIWARWGYVLNWCCSAAATMRDRLVIYDNKRGCFRDQLHQAHKSLLSTMVTNCKREFHLQCILECSKLLNHAHHTSSTSLSSC